ncbi:thioredoxin family protein [Methanothermococcus okinawensis]|uniref:Glutaredoxin n=1 Tax=Methanothermococcus okinawensis (strain DSM 14208 / JCM 11175 / IH1) TaxID=647113 RepID=F8AKU1_METOI|nr:thioredoxin family protein [Methanothermococcus okinawensis]AEH07563.1 glutaredoxin [Methanothermococcus okinawensis IH1]
MLIEVITSPQCPHCPAAKRVVEEVVKKVSCDDIEVKYIDATEDEGTVKKYNIMAVPTIVIDEEVAFIGAPSSEELEKYLREKLNR